MSGLVLLTTSWVMSNPPGAAPDEDAHYVKARASAHGHLRGIRFLPPAAPGDHRGAFDRDVKRAFVLPSRGAADPRWGCNRVTGESAACMNGPPPVAASAEEVREITHLGPYQPAPYLPMGVVGRITVAAGGSPTAALYAGRAAAAAIALALLAAALVLAGGGWRLAATLVAISPMVVFLSSALNTSGIEISAAIAAAAAVVTLRQATSRLAWTVLGASGVALALARPFGPLWVAVAAVALVTLTGATGVRARVRSSLPESALAAGAVVVAALAAVAWDLAFMPRTSVPWSVARSHLGLAASTLPEVAQQSVGIFGWLDTRLPRWAVLAGEAASAIVVVGALCFGSWKHRLVVVGGLVVLVVMIVGLNVFTQIPFQFFVQARYVMPLSVMLLVVAGDGLHGAGSRLPAAVAQGVSLVAVGLHAVGWWANARQSAVGANGAVVFFGSSQWSPPGGWLVWAVVAAAGVALMAAGAIAATASAGQPPGPPDQGRL
ncbi:MAG: DUF2142 domain-containing protein [Actinobacteria bacterium]|nr:DUF2142 domain-containing protein [Actinomycetota bacterium]MBW3649707.1 DUF2142 domain-containing protein [Actinomycetota bacterium]